MLSKPEKFMKKTLQILNGIAFVSVIIINYISNIGIIDGKTIGSVSNNIQSLFTPAGYAFSIWGLIYLLLFGFIIYQGRSLFKKNINDDFINKTGIWFIVSCIANSIWVFLWIYEYTGLSCIFIFLLLFSLLKIVLNNNMQLQKVSISKFIFLHLPFVIYSGWVTVASVANVSSYLTKISWSGFGFSDEFWTITMIIIAVIINTIVVYSRKMYAFALVGAWALAAIGVANETTNSTVAFISFIGAVDLILSVVAIYLKNRKHTQ